MSALRALRRSAWVPAVLVLATILAAGSRLIVLSARAHAAQARQTAQTLATLHAQAVERQVQALADAAERAASMPVRARPQPSLPHTFTWAADGAVTGIAGTDATTARALVSDWSSERGGEATILGPVREDSEWLIAAGVPRHAEARLARQ
ncbi:MAG: hypothetical protein ACREUG_10530 [Steroidobacteraceae bacterium]